MSSHRTRGSGSKLKYRRWCMNFETHPLLWEWAPEQGTQGSSRVFNFEDLQSSLSVVPWKKLLCLNRVVGSDTSQTYQPFWDCEFNSFLHAVWLWNNSHSQSTLGGNSSCSSSWVFIQSSLICSFLPEWASHIPFFISQEKKPIW